ncbi:tRNA lysidine(34) synthetase TilS [Psychroserpens sp. SPM9]|uniref:tRNA lysidine(34) synthetase TilS n=1 Tax=Psychroserpens sp. SPM9 TaxID=2975598 RepID=UPI0021A43449|nr:tRNA lysidine(34) synthetase TilS [Psychroserpens sp. SPM9]MDG5491794.1 tRNA lysidine(34) synthetase TilS [Psychroserpens sp. SPM9]
MNLDFESHINNKLKFLTKAKLLIAISGGVDSVVLTHLCHELKLDITLAHCNFNLRGKESDQDENFILELAEQLGLEVFTEHFNTEAYAKQNKLSIQMAARALRYQWFDELSKALKFDYLLTAHHADDNLETVLINLTRGTGLNGLTGIPEINANIVRPLLPFSRESIESYAKLNNYKWREDSSNSSDKYLRNKLRHHVIPVLKEGNPELLQSFSNTLEHLKDTANLVDDSIHNFLDRAVASETENHIKFNISEFKKLTNTKAYIFEIFKDYGFTEWNDILDLLDAQSGKQVFSNTHRLLKDREHLILTHWPVSKQNDVALKIEATDKKVQTRIGSLFFDEADAIFGKRTNVIFVDKETLQFPLLLRKWEEGDYFYPLGMKGKKKLSKYFKDEKYSLLDKENTWILCSDDKIVWIVGKRADERFKVTKTTSEILKIELNKTDIL